MFGYLGCDRLACVSKFFWKIWLLQNSRNSTLDLDAAAEENERASGSGDRPVDNDVLAVSVVDLSCGNPNHGEHDGKDSLDTIGAKHGSLLDIGATPCGPLSNADVPTPPQCFLDRGSTLCGPPSNALAFPAVDMSSGNSNVDELGEARNPVASCLNAAAEGGEGAMIHDDAHSLHDKSDVDELSLDRIAVGYGVAPRHCQCGWLR